jgi:hypothetical protein
VAGPQRSSGGYLVLPGLVSGVAGRSRPRASCATDCRIRCCIICSIATMGHHQADSCLPSCVRLLCSYLAFAAAGAYVIVLIATRRLVSWDIALQLSALMWASLIALSIWPPLKTLLPRVETEEGWKICWEVRCSALMAMVASPGGLHQQWLRCSVCSTMICHVMCPLQHLQAVLELPVAVTAGAAHAMGTGLRSTQLASQRLFSSALPARLLSLRVLSTALSEWQQALHTVRQQAPGACLSV